jgi:hypothetical protein
MWNFTPASPVRLVGGVYLSPCGEYQCTVTSAFTEPGGACQPRPVVLRNTDTYGNRLSVLPTVTMKILGYDAVQFGISLPTFQTNVILLSSRLKSRMN